MRKEDIERIIGREIVGYEVKPTYDSNGKLISWDIRVQPKQTLDHIEIPITIKPTSELKDE